MKSELGHWQQERGERTCYRDKEVRGIGLIMTIVIRGEKSGRGGHGDFLSFQFSWHKNDEGIIPCCCDKILNEATYRRKSSFRLTIQGHRPSSRRRHGSRNVKQRFDSQEPEFSSLSPFYLGWDPTQLMMLFILQVIFPLQLNLSENNPHRSTQVKFNQFL